MDLSSDWRSPWTISSTFSAPSLLQHRDGSLLVFSPSHPHRTLLSSSSLFPHVPPPTHKSTFQHDLLSYFRSCPEDFVPDSVQKDLLDSLLPIIHQFPAYPHSKDHIFANHLNGLLSRDRTMLFLFFPVGDNAHHVGYLGLPLHGSGVQGIVCSSDGHVFEQCEGFRHPCHRIIQIAVQAADEEDEEKFGGDIEGHLLVVTMYSVNWFSVKSSCFNRKGADRRPFLVPMMKQGFQEPVKHACWNPHINGESVVLLESGSAVVIDLSAQRGVKFSVPAGTGLGEPLSCEFGVQPWILLVAGSKCVVSLDLRCRHGGDSSVLARIDNSDAHKVVHSMADDQFVAFCRSDFDFLYFSVVTKYHLLLFDTRQPMSPLLIWDHGVPNPSYVGMFKLCDLRSSESYSGIPTSKGYAILVASLWEDVFKLFCYGPSNRCESFSGSSLYAWELPSSISFSGKDHYLADNILKEDFSKHANSNEIQWQEGKDLVMGFYICPRSSVNCQAQTTNGFELIRLMSSGKLELQTYCALSPSDKLNEISKHVERPLARADVSVLYHWNDVDLQFNCLAAVKMDFLNAYLKGDLFEALAKGFFRHPFNGEVHVGFNRTVWEHINESISYFSSESVSDISSPVSIHEIALRRTILTTTSPASLYLSFSTYQELFGITKMGFEFYELPNVWTNRMLPPLLTKKPSERSTRWSNKSRPGDGLLYPVLPIPVILEVDRMLNDNVASCEGIGSDGYLLDEQCNKIHGHLFPSISLSDPGYSSSLVPLDASKGMDSILTINVSDAVYIGTTDYPACDEHFRPPQQPENNMGAFEDPENQNFSTIVSGLAEFHDRKPLETACTSDIFDYLTQVKMEYEPFDLSFPLDEAVVYRSLGKQFLKWQREFSQYKDFCASKKIPL